MVKALFPGTFDPIHYGHIDIARRASKIFDEVVVAVYETPMKNLLFTPSERLRLVKEAFSDDTNINVQGYSGLTIAYAKNINANVIVRGLRVFSDFEYEFRMALANHHLDPKIEIVALITSEQHTFISSTTVREVASLNGDVSSMVPAYVEKALIRRFSELEENQKIDPVTLFRD